MTTDRHVAHTATLAPQTVTDVSTGAVPTYQPRRRAKGKWIDAVTRTEIPDRLLAGALESAGGDPNRLWFGPDGAVWILNHTRATKCPSLACPACHPR